MNWIERDAGVGLVSLGFADIDQAGSNGIIRLRESGTGGQTHQEQEF
jgi:hypothetical protein